MSDTAIVMSLPQCNFCEAKAKYDFKTRMGPWANACETHWVQHRAINRLGTGIGQQLVVKGAKK